MARRAYVSGAPSQYRPLWPRPAVYLFGGHSEPVTVLGFARGGDIRLVDADGDVWTAPAFRIRFVEPLVDREPAA